MSALWEVVTSRAVLAALGGFALLAVIVLGLIRWARETSDESEHSNMDQDGEK